MLISNGYQPARLASIVSNSRYATGHFAVTFDDGYENVGRLAYPILREMNVPATLFMVSSGVGKTNEWDQRIGDRVEKMLSLEMLREMDANGFEIGSHTVNHAHLPQLADDVLKLELEDSRKALEDMLGRPIPAFAYPFGEWDERVRQATIDAGYEYAVSTIRGVVTPSMDKFTIPRVNIRWNNWGYLLSRKIRSAYARSRG
jgi:peptidoglycan/xylan/chitin deacetylase (PgdA/CDA1 family)